MKNYKVNIKKIKQTDFDVQAIDGENALDIVQNLLNTVDIEELQVDNLFVEEFELEVVDDTKKEEKSKCEGCKYYCSECKNCSFLNSYNIRTLS